MHSQHPKDPSPFLNPCSVPHSIPLLSPLALLASHASLLRNASDRGDDAYRFLAATRQRRGGAGVGDVRPDAGAGGGGHVAPEHHAQGLRQRPGAARAGQARAGALRRAPGRTHLPPPRLAGAITNMLKWVDNITSFYGSSRAKTTAKVHSTPQT
eukprot:1193354-Prorocentrum_minimum.AAC.1